MVCPASLGNSLRLPASAASLKRFFATGFLFLIASIALLLLIGCSSNDDSSPLVAIETVDAPMVAQVNLPAALTLLNLTVDAPGGSVPVDAAGQCQIPTADDKTAPFLVSARADGVPVALAFLLPEAPDNTIGCRETAVALTLLTTFSHAAPPEYSAELLRLARETPAVEAFGNRICTDLAEDSTALVNPGAEFVKALQDAVQGFSTSLAAQTAR